ncbi:hypothetical protein [Streptosporangium amethystogenes]|uniref:hypothetical protein n=1 Tax=Streptosporangium amethystogenes TaxID=2002 RepID=UPI0004C848E8|nr:hypothetical protein [Streptosporangium amethystogenes]
MTDSEHESYVPRRLSDPTDDPPHEEPQGCRRIPAILVTAVIVVLIALVGVTFLNKPLAGGDNRSTARCVDTSSRQADGTHRLVDRRRCESDEGRRGQYRWQSQGKTSDSGRERSVLRRIGDFIGDLFGGGGRRR